MELKVNKELEEIIPKLSEEEYKILKDSIKEKGLLKPIDVMNDGTIVDGHHRYKACIDLNVKPLYSIMPNINSTKEALDYSFDINFKRRNLNTFQKAEWAYKVKYFNAEKYYKKEIPKQYLGLDSITKRVSKDVGIGQTTFDKVKKIINTKNKELINKVRKGKISVNAAYIQIKRKEKHVNTPELPKEEYNVIYADPPWKYDFCLEGNPEEHYKEMSLDQICKLQIPSAKDSILFLWVTNPKIEDALQVIKAWGFKYITNLVWVKQTKGLGYYSMAQHELLFICKKGDIPPPQAENRPLSVIHADRKEHSKKPEVFYDIIEKMYPNRKYLELFARSKRKNWVSWGNEVK